jgi:hypothetical protein
VDKPFFWQHPTWPIKNTAEGKVIVAAFTDPYNNLARAVKKYKPSKVARCWR